LSLSSTLNLSQSDNTTVSTPQYYTWSWTKFKAYSPYKDTSQNPAQWNIGDAINFSKALYGESNPSITDELVISHNPEDTKLWKIVWQVFNSYIIVEAHDRIQIYDQHALAERIIYEKLIKNAYKASSQWLLLSESFTLQASEYDLIREHESSVRDFWFDFELLWNNILQITAIPDFIKKENLRTIIEWLLEDLASNKIAASETLEEVRNKIAAYTACRSAIKFGHKLSTLEMKALLDDAVNDYSETCPHGRPVIHELSLEEMSKLYDR
jgi:DNA mismatch repair protein MutL